MTCQSERDRSTTVTPPPCIRCGAPVKRSHGSWKSQRGDRIVDGVRWCWCCSRACNGSNRERLTPDIRARIGRANRETAERRVLERITAACKGAMDERGMVPAKAIARAWMLTVRQAYANGYSLALLKAKHDRVTEAA